ncbi:MAG: LCP family protein [Coriobacteriia bacterium]|nr:LCP family protein [Coriobacteriia bacterium]
MSTNKKRPSIKARRKEKRSFKLNITEQTKKRIAIGAIAAIVIAIGIAIGIFTFMATTSSKLSISDEAKSALNTPQENQPRFTLIQVDIDDDGSADMFVLLRSDPRDKQCIIVTIPVDTYVASAKGGGTTLSKISKTGSDEDLIKAVSSFCETGINHYIKINGQGLEKLVDYIGGIEVDLKEQTDDPSVGSTYIPGGVSTINGNQTIALLKSKNYSGGSDTVNSNQRTVSRALVRTIPNQSKTDPIVILDNISGDLKSDINTGTFLDINKIYKDITDDDILDTTVPGNRTTRSNEMVYVIDASSWKNIKQQMQYGSLPQAETSKTLKDVDASSFTIQIQNGSGVDGSAALLADKLKGMGCNVTEVGNAENKTYKETLIIYKNKDFKEDALAIKGSINNGRIVNGDGLYNIKTDILIIIGGDFKI